MRTERRVGRYTKYETAELTRMFGEGYSVYKICRNLNRSQNSIRNNLIIPVANLNAAHIYKDISILLSYHHQLT